MTVGIAVRDDAGITHWAPYSNKDGKASNAGRNIVREMQKTTKPRLYLMCENYENSPPRINQVKRVSTRIASVTCMTCIVRM